MNAATSRLDWLAQRSEKLCSLPGVAMRVLELTRDPQVGARELKDCIENDPALAAKILRVVNSSLFGLPREVSDLNQALALLGMKPLKLLVLGFSMPPALFQGLSSEMLGRYWRRTLTKAVAARELGERVWRRSADDAFLAGLLQDIGMLVLIQELGGPYIKFLEKITVSGQDLNGLECEALGFDHTTLSARVLSRWGLPEPLVDATSWRPELLSGAECSELARILALAELVARLVIDGRSDALDQFLDLGRSYPALNAAQVDRLVESLEGKVEQLADVLAVQLPRGMDYHDVLAESQSQLSDVAADAAGDLVRQRTAAPAALKEESVLEELGALSQSLREAVAQAASPVNRPVLTDEVARPEPIPVAPPPPPPPPPAPRRPEESLVEILESSVASCRAARCSLSLLLVEFASLERVRVAVGRERLQSLVDLVRTMCYRLDHEGMRLLDYGRDGFAVVLPDCDRRQAAELGNRLLATARHFDSLPAASGELSLALAVGTSTVPLPPKNFPPRDLLSAAERCLNASRASGGNVLKGIEIF